MVISADGATIYTVFGLRIRSAIDLPELPRLAAGGAVADVTIERGYVAPHLPGAMALDPGMQVAGEWFQLDVPPARYAVSQGRSIVVDPRPGAVAEDVRRYLFGTVMGALRHQRRPAPLHAAAVLFGERAVGFAGVSGAGKSTLAAQLQSRGRTVIADDLCAVDVRAGSQPWALPGLPRIKLWPESPALAGATDEPGATAAGRAVKVTLAVDGGAEPRASPLWRLYILRPDGGGIRICKLTGPDAVAATLGQVYRWPLAVAMGQAPARFAQCVAIVKNCEIFEVVFAHDTLAPLAVADALERHLEP